MRKNRAANFFAPTLLAQPGDADERVTFRRALLLVRMPLVIHVVEQAHRLPQIRIRAAQLRKMPHRISHRIAMPAQTLRLDPLVQKS